MKENYSNFATSTLATPSPLTSTGLLFTVAAGQGALFPVQNFLVTIDTEIMLIASRAGDTFTVATRGIDSTTATSHTVGTTVQHCVTQYTLQHLWQNLSDAYNPDVPPAHVGGTASQWDNEFESQGSWTLYPTSLPGNAVFDAGVTMRSHLYLRRATTGDNQLYSAYIPFSPTAGTAFTITCKVSEGVNQPQNGNQNVETHLFVTDQTNPTGGPDGGNRVRVDTVMKAATDSSGRVTADTARFARGSKDVNGTWTGSSTVTISTNAPAYLRLTYDGAGRWRTYFGDGYIYWLTSDISNFNFTVRTLCIQFAAYPSSGFTVMHAAAVDWVRVVMGSAIQYNGV